MLTSYEWGHDMILGNHNPFSVLTAGMPNNTLPTLVTRGTSTPWRRSDNDRLLLLVEACS